MKFTLPPLPYPHDALEPFIDQQTMTLHHDKHHQTYVDKLNEALAKHPEIQAESPESLLKNPDQLPADIRTAVINHGGGHANHSFFWQIMSPAKQIITSAAPEVSRAAIGIYGSLDSFKEQFLKTAAGHFGSGWTWLALDSNRKLSLYSLPNQDSPVSRGETPILTVDVWEHAYYLKYQNRRSEYLDAWWNVVNWQEVEKKYNLLAEGPE